MKRLAHLYIVQLAVCTFTNKHENLSCNNTNTFVNFTKELKKLSSSLSLIKCMLCRYVVVRAW